MSDQQFIHFKNTSFSTAKSTAFPSTDHRSVNNYVTAADEKSSVIQLLQRELETLKQQMRSELDDLKKRLTLCEDTNKKLLSQTKTPLDKSKQPPIPPKQDFDAIAEEYKSKKREINEFIKQADAVPTVGYNIKELQKISNQKGRLTGTKKKESVQLVQKKQKINEPKQKPYNSFMMKTPEPTKKTGQRTQQASKLQIEEEVDNEYTIPLQMCKPQESPYRAFKNSLDNIQINQPINNQGINRSTNQLVPQSGLSSLSQSPIPSQRERKTPMVSSKIIQNDLSYRDVSKSQLGISTSQDHPKFLDFINGGSGRESTGFSILNSIFSRKPDNSKTKPMVNQIKEVIASQQTHKKAEETKQNSFSPNYFYKKWLDITSKDRGKESEQSTERGDKPELKNRQLVGSKINKMDQSTSSMDDEEMQSEDCDEKRSYTPEPKHLTHLISEPAKNLNHSIIGLKSQVPASAQNVNCVYKSSKMELSSYISDNKSKVDYKNKYNVLEFGGKQALIDNKGSKCTCKRILEGVQESKRATCSTYCKHLTQAEQKKIILQCLKKDLESGNTSAYGIRPNQKQKKYIIDGKWWRKWCDYVNFDSSNLNATLDQIESQLEELESQHQDHRLQRTYDSSALYCKPERICNENLLDKKNKSSVQKLRENLVEHYDFEQLSPQLWMHLYSWYSADQQIARYLKKDKLNTNSFLLELYPNRSFLGYESSESEKSEDSRQESSGGTPDIKTINSAKQDQSINLYNQQKGLEGTQKVSFFGLSIPQRKKWMNSGKD